MELHQIESFALAADRAKSLEQLIPGTEDYYFHACLLHEQKGQLGEIDAILQQWIKRHGHTAMVREIVHRVTLLRYGAEPKKALTYLRDQLGLDFSHQRAVEGRQTKHPTALDPKLITRDAVLAAGQAQSSTSDLSGFTDAALEWLIDEQMDTYRLRHFLGRLQRPDHARLVELVLAELSDPHSSGFGSLPIHGLLLQQQLEQLAKKRPALLAVEAFVNACLVKLQPGPDVDWVNDFAPREAYLDRLWAFVKDLAPSFNALKAHVLYHRLDHDRRAGTYSAVRFLEYLKLPRQVSYANPEHLKQLRSEGSFGLGQDYRHVTLHTPFSSDEELVRDYLAQLLRDAKDTRAYEPYVQAAFLREVFASTKILHGVGDMEQWYSLLNDPAAYQALKERVEIQFARSNPGWFGGGDRVSLDVDVKNVGTLVVKVFEINSLNYFLAHGRDLDTSVDLDGLVASEERTCTYQEPPARRMRRTFDFPTLTRPGVYVVELIGGGISSRALVRKSRLRFLERVGAGGHVFTVLDEARNERKTATLWLAGHEYRPDEHGSIHVPFSTSPGRQSILLRDGELTTLEAFEHQAESYQLTAGLYVDRESLLRKCEAQLLVRPTLRLNGVPVSLSLLEEVALVIQSTDRDGVSSSVEVNDFKLHEREETAHTFQVPEGLASISFTLRAKVQNVTQGRKTDLGDARSFTLNGMDAEAAVEDLHLARTARGCVVTLAGKSGEPRTGVPLNVTLRHRDLNSTLEFTLQTDAEGRVELGHLRDITHLQVATPGGHTSFWDLPRDGLRRVTALHLREGEAFRVPWMEVVPLGAEKFPDERGRLAKPARAPERQEVSLLERRGQGFVRDHFEALALEEGYLTVKGLPAGDYDLLLKREGARLTVRVAPGVDREGWIAGERRHLERRDVKPLQITSAELGKKELKISLGNASAGTRVHVFGTRYVPAYSSLEELGRAPLPSARTVELRKAPSHYLSGRDIGDEYRYILERKYAEKFVGNMLPRPGLLLNPWAVRTTQTATQDASVGAGYAASPPPAPGYAPAPSAEPRERGGDAGHFANLDFLAHPAAVLANLVPDADGVVTVARAALGQHANQLRLVAVDALGTVSRDLLLPEVATEHQDLRLRLALDASKHFTEKKQVTVLPENTPLEIADLTTSKLEVYDTLGRVYRLYATLSGDATLATFGFILRWPSLTDAEKRAKYSEFACHELSFFLARKDPVFFEEVITPYLRHKRDKTFLDRYLLGDDLSAYRTPWAYGRLNIVERILLGQRLDDERGPIARSAGDLNDLLPRDLEGLDRLFKSAIQSSALEAGDALGIGQATQAAEASAIADFARVMPVMSAGRAAPSMERAMAAPKSVAAAAPARRSVEKKKASKSDRMEMDDEGESLDMMKEESFGGPGGGGMGRGARDLAAREQQRQFFQRLDTTQEWAENNYYRRTVEQQGPELVRVNAFWRDYARHDAKGPFLSPNLAQACNSFTEMMFALSVLELPFEAARPQTTFEGARLKLVGKTRAIAFHKEIKPAQPASERVPVLVSQNYFRDDDRTRYENGEEHDKYVTGEFLVGVVYVCQVVLTNPTSASQKLELLMQIPQGAIPVRGGFVTRGAPTEISSYATESIEYAFYFPGPGKFAHFPVHVARNEQLITSAEPTRLEVVRELSTVDKTSWAWLSQHGDDKDVLRWMDENNLDRLAAADGDGDVGLELIAWRMREPGFYKKCIALLRKRHVYNGVLWAYSVHHDDPANIRELLLHHESFADQCGLWLDSPLLTLDPVVRHRYQHLEYAPLVNARAHRLGAQRKILNDRLAAQYRAWLESLRYRTQLLPGDLLATAYYLFLQDRIAEGLATFAAVNPEGIESRVQYDYLDVYAQLYREQPAKAHEVALRHKDHPVDRWRNLFQAALAQLDEITGAAHRVVDEKDRDQRQAQLASTEPDLDFTVEKKTVTVHFQNLSAVRVNYYLMDIELLFSRQPFVQQQSGQFAFIKPNRTEEVALPAGRTTFAFDLPAEYQGANVVVELVASGKRKSQACYAHDLVVQVVENYGQVRVAKQGTNEPLPKTYLKVYARMKGGEVKFFKDGATDLRGRFDYASLSTNELDHVERFSILILSTAHGAVIREAAPPKR